MKMENDVQRGFDDILCNIYDLEHEGPCMIIKESAHLLVLL